jgi:hypothetical protein
MELGPSKYESQMPAPQAVVDDRKNIRIAIMEAADRWHTLLRRGQQNSSPLAISVDSELKSGEEAVWSTDNVKYALLKVAGAVLRIDFSRQSD